MGTRRPLRTRETRWAQALAARLAAWHVRPNAVSVLSVVFAALGGVAFVLAPRVSPTPAALLLVGAAVSIQLRLLCNMFDGMIAVESGRGSPAGDLYNEFPDRIADSLFLASAGYAVTWVSWGPTLGWLAALLAVITAYARALAGSCGATQSFAGPMAKPQRMAVMTAASVLSAIECAYEFRGRVLLVALLVVCAGCAVTTARRLLIAAQELRGARQ